MDKKTFSEKMEREEHGELFDLLHEVGQLREPEPEQAYWNHFQARVDQRIRAQKNPWKFWQILLPLAGVAAVAMLYVNFQRPAINPQLESLENDALSLIEDAFLPQTMYTEETASMLDLELELEFETEGFEAIEDWDSIDYDKLIQTYSEG